MRFNGYRYPHSPHAKDLSASLSFDLSCRQRRFRLRTLAQHCQRVLPPNWRRMVGFISASMINANEEINAFFLVVDTARSRVSNASAGANRSFGVPILWPFKSALTVARPSAVRFK